MKHYISEARRDKIELDVVYAEVICDETNKVIWIAPIHGLENAALVGRQVASLCNHITRLQKDRKILRWLLLLACVSITLLLFR